MIWIMQDNYELWRYTRRGADGMVSTGSEAFPTRDAAKAHAEALFPNDEILTDGITAGVNMEPHVPLPRVDAQQEAVAGGYAAP